MRRRQRHRLGTLLLAAAVAAAGLVGSGTAQAAPGLDRAVTAAFGAARADEATTAYGLAAGSALQTLVEPHRASRDGSWVFGGAAFRLPSTSRGGPVTALFFAHREDGRWEIGLEGTPEFADAAREAPPELMGAGERRTLAATAEPAALTAATGLALPWRVGDGGWRHWGVHGDSGTSTPYNAIDFYGGDRYVRASQAGRLYRFCGTSTPFIKVVHDNGWTTGYYHTYNQTTVADGSRVELGDYIGEIGERLPCGGRANGDHVHWTLWRGDTPVSVHGKEIGGWTWYAQSRAYQGYAVRNGVYIYNSDCCLTNYGAGEGYPTGVVRNDGGRVNVRTGPSFDATIVRSEPDGTVVEIVCTTRGDEATGPWGNTSDIWDRLPDGYYMSDAFIDTGTNDPVAPPCE